MNVAVIPARGGSKRIPRKNIKEFCGKAIINYSIEAALKSNLFDKVVVSTDDHQIAKIALQLGKQRLGREVTVLTGVFTTLKQQLETTKIEEVKESNYVVILDAPEVPLQQSKSNKKLVVILAGFLGLGLGMVLAFFREYATNSEKEEKDKMTEAKFLIRKNILELIPGKSK